MTCVSNWQSLDHIICDAGGPGPSVALMLRYAGNCCNLLDFFC